MATKRTVIAADEELLVKGTMTVDGQVTFNGNVTQIETTQLVNRLESDSLVINSNGSNVTANLVLNSNNTLATISFDATTGNITIDQPVNFSSGNISGTFVGDLTGNVAGNLTGNVIGNVTGNVTGNVSGNAGTATILATTRTIRLTGDVTGSATFNGSADANITATIAANSVALGTDTTGNYVSTITAGTGLSSTGATSGENIAHTLSLAASGVTAATYGTSSTLPAITVDAYGRITAASNVNINHDALTNFVANEHVDHSTVSITAGSGLTGGGTIAATRTINVGAGDGITVNADNVAVNATVIRTTGNQTITGNIDLTGAVVTASTQANSDNSTKVATTAYVDNAVANLIDGAPGALDTLNELAAALNDDASLGSTVTNNELRITALEGTTLTAGNGLTGGGNLSTNRTFDIGAGDGITVNSANIAVDSTVVRTSGDQSLADVKTFTGTLIAPSTTSTANGAIFYDNSVGEAYIYVAGLAKKITPAVDAGDVEDVGATGVNIYAGTRISGNITYHGIKSIDSGTYTTVSEASNVITVDGNISAIRGAFSAINTGGYGAFSYNPATGAYTYTGVSDSSIRSLFSGTGLISYNNSTGVISTTADNYANWLFTTSGTAGNATVSSGNLVTINGGTGISVAHNATTRTITITNSSTADITGVTAGSYLTGGGTTGTVTLNVDATSANTPSKVVARDANGNFSADTITSNLVGNVLGNITGNAGTATQLATARTISLTGDVTGSASFDGSANASITASLAASGVTAGTYGTATTMPQFAVDTYGRITSVSNVTISADITGVTAGAGLTGGGTSGTVTLNIGAGTGITVNADNVALTSGVVTAGSSTGGISAITVDTYGRVTSVTGSAGYSTTNGTVTSVVAGGYLTGGTITTSGTLAVDATTTATASKVVARDASGDIYANVFQGTATSARYADLAENYLADQQYFPGTVLVFGGKQEVTTTSENNSPRIAGVVTTQPAHLMNSDLKGEYVTAVALRGRIPCKVIGRVRKGDVLISSITPGFAEVGLNPHFIGAACIVGKAIENKDTDGEGVVEILV